MLRRTHTQLINMQSDLANCGLQGEVLSQRNFERNVISVQYPSV